MHVHAYRLRLEPMLWNPEALTPARLAGRLAGDAVVHEFVSHESGAHTVGITLQRDRESHPEALNELLIAAQEVGYTFVEGAVARVADRAIEMAFGLGVSGLGAGASTEKGEAAVLGGMLGWVVGLFVGVNMKKIEVMYEARWTGTEWQLVRVTPPRTPVRPALRSA